MRHQPATAGVAQLPAVLRVILCTHHKSQAPAPRVICALLAFLIIAPALPAQTGSSVAPVDPPDPFPAEDSGLYQVPWDADPPQALADVNTRIYLQPPEDLTLNEQTRRTSEALAHYAQGSILQDLNEESAALEHFQKTLDLDPGHFELASRIATLLVRRGEVPRALNVLKDSIKANPDEPSTYRYLSFLFHRYQDKADRAIEYARQAITVAPEDFQTHAVLYDIYEQEEEIEKAYWVLRNAADRESENPDFWVQLGQAFWRHLLEYSASEYDKELERLNSYFQRAEKHAGEDINVLDQVANFYISSNQRAEAVELFRRIIELEPNYMLVRDRLAHNLIEMGKINEAIEVLEDTARLAPNRYETFEQLALLHEQQGNLKKALSYFRSCIEISPQNPFYFLKVGVLHMQMGQENQAIDIFSLAREKYPDTPDFMVWKARALMQAKRHEEAFETFSTAERFMQAEQFDKMLDSDFYFSFGASAERSGQIEIAEDYLRKSIELDPENPHPYNYLGYTWVDRGEHLEEAAALIRRALELDPENPAYLDSLGWYYYRKGNYQQALEHLEKSKQLVINEENQEGNWEIYEHLGDTYAKLNQPENALSNWELALEGAPEERQELIRGKIQELREKDLAGVQAADNGQVLGDRASSN